MNNPLIIKSPQKLQNLVYSYKKRNKKIGFVPTMGALHKGHLSLIKKARKETDIVVVSIFVNPTQFGPNEDFKSYPRTFKEDIKLCKEYNVDIIFYPSVNTLYPDNYLTYVSVEKLSNFLCGKFRPGHFKGVATIVAKLFNIVSPDIAYFGLKDYQQYIIIKKMVRDLNFNIKIKGCPTIREKDGLALSSRNKYLSPEERNEAILLSKSLFTVKKLIQEKKLKSVDKVKNKILDILLSGNIIQKKDIDYIEIVDAETLEEKKDLKGKFVIALAVHIGKARLIDNIIIRN